ncbi:MAG: M48 family metallopeptidase [Clostridia bacterium]|nr:M48 family metallopeptidase [Clostridia bacterium]
MASVNGTPEYTLIRSDRKTLSIEVKADGTLIARAPRRLARAEIDAFIAQKADWIETSREKMRRRAESPSPYRRPLSEEEIRALAQKAAEYLPGRIEYWSSITGLHPTGVRITGAQKRFGSCSPKNSLCFSYRLMLYPPEAIDYVVLHELAHIRHHNHSGAFYALIERYMPDYKEREALLRQ